MLSLLCIIVTSLIITIDLCSLHCHQAIGVVGVAIMTAMITRGNEEVQIYDRSYRIRHNKGQSHLDLVTYPTVGAGAVTGALLASSRATGVLMGGSVGFGLSVLIHMLTKGKE